jgi:nitrous oxidase accessory protein
LNTSRGINIGPVVENNTIVGNTISFTKNAIRVQNSIKNRIFQNEIRSNDRGILLCCGSIDNMVYSNTFKNNSVWHGYDLFHNAWDKGGVGNFWDDYFGKDKNQDGIGDYPYNITGGIAQDNYPLIRPNF